ncbi:MAG: tubulin-like doman-containing protein [Gemmataceae bacterium]
MERLGSGGFGEVWKTEAPGGIFKAIKFIHGDLRTRDNDLVRYAEQELKALNRVKTVRHPYLLSLDRIDIVEGRLMIIMELADCNLWDRFRHYRQQGQIGIPREELLRYFVESAEVLDLMNDTFSLQHLDIKPQNLFLLHHHVKVADFGQVKDLQGSAAEVTGGITPVYAAPETFEGYISKFCDQYSLACVYQELLTGVRPFDGTSMQQLLVQHVEQKPNLDPSPLEDRPALTKALAKKPEDRFPSCMQFVQALIRKNPVKSQSRSKIIMAPSLTTTAATIEQDPHTDRIDIEMPSGVQNYQASAAISVELSGTPLGSSNTPFPTRREAEPTPRLAPIEETGPGSLRPTLVIGLGGLGLRVLRRFRKMTRDRYGNPDRLPLIRTLYIDTDPTDLEQATQEIPAAKLPGLSPDSIYAANLYRAGHYLKPRLSGKSLFEGWFDSQLLYRIGRVPLTGGNRSFGRLAYFDHFRNIAKRIAVEFEKAIDPQSYEATRARTGLALATNRPRVYITGGLAGGTASGMFIDLAYTLRAHLKFLGYSDPDLVGLFFVPNDGPIGDLDALAQANVYAALTELNHYSRPESIFSANFDDRNGSVRDGGKPFRSVYLFRAPDPVSITPPQSNSGTTMMPNRQSGSQVVSGSSRFRQGATVRNLGTPSPLRSIDANDKSIAAAELIRVDLFTTWGRNAEPNRPEAPTTGAPVVRTFDFSHYYWPRGEIVNRTANDLSRIVLANWISTDVKRARDIIPSWTADTWTRLGLDPDPLIKRMADMVSQAAGGPIDQLIDAQVAPLQPRSWLDRSADVGIVATVLTNLVNFFGAPVISSSTAALVSPIEEAVCPIAVEIVKQTNSQLNKSLPKLCDDETLRIAGTEEAANQFVAGIDRLVGRFNPQIEQLDAAARSCFEIMMAATTSGRGRKSTAKEIMDAAKQFAHSRLQSVIYREVVNIYKHVRKTLTEFLVEASACRQRLEVELQKLLLKGERAPGQRNPRELLPPQCETIKDAVDKFTNSLTDEDLQLLERRIQSAVVDQFDGLFNACLNVTDGMIQLLDLIQDESRMYLDAVLTDIDLQPMLAAQFRTQETAQSMLATAFQESMPNLVGPGPWSKNEITLVATPPNPKVRQLAHSVLMNQPAIAVDSRDELAYIREYPSVPLAALPQLGPSWEASYLAACEVTLGNPHCRGDVAKWVPIDAS